LKPVRAEQRIWHPEVAHRFGILNLEFGIWNLESEGPQNLARRIPVMRYKRFEDLPVWNTAIELAIGVYMLTSKPEFDKRFSLKDQLERAAVSVSNNIAEGFERGTNNELLAFLYISRGSAGETRSILCLLDRIHWLLNYILTLPCYEQKRRVARGNLRRGWARSRILI
jgi:four helix bundle protein